MVRENGDRKKSYFTHAINQLALEYDTTPEAFSKTGLTITRPARPEGIRVYSHNMPFFKMAATGNSVVAMADERIHGFLEQLAGELKDSHRLLEYPALCKIDEKLHEYDRVISGTFHFYMPGESVPNLPIPSRFSVRFFEGEEAIGEFYPNERFPMALGAKYNPDRPDVIAHVAYDGEKIAAMAGASADTHVMWQVGIDVLPDYRSCGLGSSLVSALSRRIIEMGKVPFYGTAVANIHSQNIAINCGFRPAWVEVEGIKR